jgi:uncharacterized protein involved in exopolysaccharide biosynthesis
VKERWATGEGRRLIVVASTLVFAGLGVLWIHMTVHWGGGTYCEGPPGEEACVSSPPQWNWIVFGMALGAFFGFVLALVALWLRRLASRYTGRHPR